MSHGILTSSFALALAFGGASIAQEKKHDHPDEGPHHGCLAEWGEEEYHVEFTVDRKTGTATVYILGGDAKKAKPIDAKEVTLTIKGKKAVSVDLKPKPDKDDPSGKCSRFVGTHKSLKATDLFSGTVSAEVGGKPYSGDFKQTPHDHKHDK